MINNFTYEYSEVPDYMEPEDFYSQKYEDFDKKSAVAIYTPPVSDYDKGNIFIEALPRVRSRERLTLDCTKGIDYFNHDEIIRKSPEEQITLLADLYNIRKTLPSQYTLEGMLSTILIRVYRSRYYKIVDSEFNQKKDSEKVFNGFYAYGKVGEAPPAGFSLLGYAGCGKSSMIGDLVGHYPQVIWHQDEINSFPQITYLTTSANSSSNRDFFTILNDIARQIDIALGFDEGLYYGKVSKLATYSKKIGLIKQLISQFNIGAIVIDEIQSLDFRKNDRETYSKLLQITNDTKVGFILVGTESAYEKMFSELHMHRRFPPLIASDYTGSIKFVNLFLKDLFQYQWFKEEIKIPEIGELDPEWEDIVSAFFECTNGIVALIVGLYEKVNFDYIIKKRKPKIDGAYIKRVFKKYFGNLGRTLEELDRDFSYGNIKKSLNSSNLTKSRILSQLEVDKQIDEGSNKALVTESQKKAKLLQSMTKSIFMCLADDFTDTQIENACKAVLAKKKSLDKTEKVLTKEAIELLKSKPKNPKNNVLLPPALNEIINPEKIDNKEENNG